MTHNINPHSGDNNPGHAQVFTRALTNPKVVVRGGTRSPKNKKSVLKDLESQRHVVKKIVRVPRPPR